VRLALDLNLPTDTPLLAATRRSLRLYLEELGAASAVVDDVILAMDEACTNVIRHAYPEGGAGNYRLRADLAPDKILIEVIDDGVGFDLMARPPPVEGDAHLALSGRGLEVMRRLMTTVEVESPTASGGTRLRLVRLLPPVCEEDTRHPLRA
jgi:anti-sigma regulatory factor (Ser/Thr protein kinase)